jgi:hypothetical protein
MESKCFFFQTHTLFFTFKARDLTAHPRICIVSVTEMQCLFYQQTLS